MRKKNALELQKTNKNYITTYMIKKKTELFVTNSICFFLWMIVISCSKNLHSFIQMLYTYSIYKWFRGWTTFGQKDFKTDITVPQTTQSPIL